MHRRPEDAKRDKSKNDTNHITSTMGELLASAHVTFLQTGHAFNLSRWMCLLAL